ncbi:MAG: carotenoid biosynthesis protein [Flammeovirgaceae bacterium]
MEREKYQYKIAVTVLIALHFFGFLGMRIEWMNEVLRQLSPFESFTSLTPLNLLITLFLLLFFHKDWNRQAVFFCITAFTVGFLVEWIGVHTGWIFGEYWYGATLGWKIDQIPILIGVNWLILTYCVSGVVHRLEYPIYLKALATAVLMVFIDFLIEPVAIKFDFWQWQNETIPLSNYMGWLITAFVLSLLFHYLSFKKNNPLIIPILVCQVLFFLAHNI